MAYDTTNRGAIWKNDDKQNDNHPDFKGSINVDGKDYWISARKGLRQKRRRCPLASSPRTSSHDGNQQPRSANAPRPR
jgi:hypothetical protein